MTLGPGKYYPRIARPLDALVPAWEPRLLWSQSFNVEKAYVANARSQLTSLTRKLETICQTVQPSESTLAVYGHEIRNLLILAGTEAEMHWRGILIANGAPRTTKFNSNEYFKLVEPLKLRDYAINFYDFPDLPPFPPPPRGGDMNPDDIFNRLLYVMTALAVGAAFVSGELFTSQLAAFGNAIYAAVF